MKRIFRFAALLLPVALLVASCVKEFGSEEGGLRRTYDFVDYLDSGTKTDLDDGDQTIWKAGDPVAFYTSGTADAQIKTVETDGPVAEFYVEAAEYVNAVYGADVLQNGKRGFKLQDVVKSEQNGSFGNAHVSVAHTLNLENPELHFRNITSMLRFKVKSQDVVFVRVYSRTNAQLGGDVLVMFDSNTGEPTASFTGENPIYSIKVSTQDKDGYFYVSLLPGTYKGGIEVRCFNRNGSRIASAVSKKDFTLAKNRILDMGVLDNYFAPEQGGGTESGLYLGIIGFNDELYKMDIERLDASSKTRFDSFINSLTTKNGTLLYYSVDQALRTLQLAQYPDDLYNVSLVTFTDGLDMGSPMMMDNYTTDEECLQNLNNRLSVSSVSGVPITAYSVGLRGNDVNTSQQVEMFRKNLKKLAYPESNAYEEYDMSSVNARFQEIADKISQTTSTTKYNFELTIPGKATGTVWRFTLDGASSATNSSLYIEGTFNLSTKALTNITYHGMTCSSGSTVQGQVNGIHITYSFSDIIPDGTSTISKDRVWTWWYAQSSSDFWQGNTEFDKDEDVKITVSHTKRSAVVLLDLDCSKSLDNQFYSLKNYAKDFIATLYNASFDPYAVTGITLDNSTMTLYVGNSSTLTATISPFAAAEKSVQWSSSNPSVATVDSNGKVTGVKAGTATITATTYDGGYTASCMVSVKEVTAINGYEYVDLGLPSGLKWATMNVGASKPEGYGDYFAWGETQPKSNYNWSTYKWCNGSENTQTKYNTSSSYGTVDNKTVLDPEDDAAHVNWGGSWRMPTYEEWKELRNNCSWTWTTQNGVKGRLVTGPNGKSIFLPAAGNRYSTSLYDAGSEGYYWSSSLCTGIPCAYGVDFSSDKVYWTNTHRHNGYSVRPVSE